MECGRPRPLSVGSAQTKQTVGEGFAAERKFGRQESDESEHRHSSVQLFGTLMESPAIGGFNNFHPRFSRESVQTPSIFLSHGCTAYDWRIGLSHDQARA